MLIREIRVKRMERNVLKCFGYVGRIGEDRMGNRVYQAGVEGDRRRVEPQRRWGEEGMEEGEEMLIARVNIERWCMVLNGRGYFLVSLLKFTILP